MPPEIKKSAHGAAHGSGPHGAAHGSGPHTPKYTHEMRKTMEMEAHNLHGQGIQFRKAGEHGKAVELHSEAVKRMAGLTLEAIADGRHNDATRHKKFLANIFNEKGNSHRNLGQLEEAKIELKNALEMNPNHVHASLNLADIHFNSGEHKEALNHYNKAIEKIGPDRSLENLQKGGTVPADAAVISAIAAKGRGLTHEAMNNAEGAAEDLSKAKYLLEGLASHNESHGNALAADYFSNQAAELSPKLSELLNRATEQKLERGEIGHGEALPNFEEAIKHNITNIDAQSNYIDALRKLGKEAEATEHVRWLKKNHRIHMK